MRCFNQKFSCDGSTKLLGNKCSLLANRGVPEYNVFAPQLPEKFVS